MVTSRLRGVPVAEQVPLAPLTTLRVGPVARRLITCETTDAVIAVIGALDGAADSGERTLVLAGGSNFDPALADLGRRQIEERLGVKAESLDVRKGVTLRDRIAAGPDVLDALAPAVGVLLRDLPPAAPRGKERVA